jgi:hypothetical protein
MRTTLVLCALLSALPLAASSQPVRRHTRSGGVSIGRDLRRMTRDPSGRDCTSPQYHTMTRWLAGRLKRVGVQPAGDGKGGLDQYLQRFSWDQRFQSGKASSENVIGVRRGDGTSNEAVLVVGHLDGLSAAEKSWYETQKQPTRQMAGYQGANDNASAVAAALYVSDAIGRLEKARGKPLHRDVIFFFPAAEEEGLKGAEAFARYSKRFAGKKIVGVVNFEMIGRGDPKKIRLFGGDDATGTAANPLYARALALTGKGSTAKVVPGLPLDGGEGWFGRSDHYVLSQAGVPSVLYLGDTGDYHTPKDNLAGIDPKTNKAVARHALRLVVGLANDPQAELPGKALPIVSRTGFSGQVYPGE